MRTLSPAFCLGLLGALVLAGCGSSGGHRPASSTTASTPTASTSAPGNGTSGPGPTSKRGGYYMDDGPGDSPPPNLEQTPDAVPRNEPPIKSAANRPYEVFGKTYTPALNSVNLRQRGVASWYGRKFHGQRTSSGEPYNMYGMSAAHPTLPIPSYVRVTNLSNGRTVVVRVNDRGPFHSDRIIDLSYTAALKLGYVGQGSAQVEIEQVRGDGSAPPVLVAAAPVAAPAPTPTPTPTPTPASVLNSSDTLSGTRPPGASTQASGSAATPAVNPPVTVSAPVTNTSVVTPAPVPVPAGPPQALPTSTQPDGVYLQLGAFGAREGADEFRTKVYQQLGWLNDAIYIVARDRLFKVQLGPYKDRTEAAAMAEKVRQGMQLSPVFVLK
jgi:rare lipoprotein A